MCVSGEANVSSVEAVVLAVKLSCCRLLRWYTIAQITHLFVPIFNTVPIVQNNMRLSAKGDKIEAHNSK